MLSITENVSFVAVTLIQGVTTRNRYVGGVFYRTDSGLVEVPSDIPPEATEIYLEDNRITELKTGTFSNFTQCTKLYIHHNSVTTIEENAFSGMGQLRTLYLHYNEITFLKKSMFSGLHSLTFLQVSSNLIETIPDGCFSDLKRLRILYLGLNRLSKISGNMWQGLSVLTSLHLHTNNIATLEPGDLDHLPILNNLLLHSNPLTTISYTIFNPSLYPETDGHPPRVEMGLGLIKCNSSLRWLKEGEQKGWITWWESNGKLYHPDCVNLADVWSNVDLTCPNYGL